MTMSPVHHVTCPPCHMSPVTHLVSRDVAGGEECLPHAMTHGRVKLKEHYVSSESEETANFIRSSAVLQIINLFLDHPQLISCNIGLGFSTGQS